MEMAFVKTKSTSDFFEGSAKETDKIFYQYGLFISNHVYYSSHVLVQTFNFNNLENDGCINNYWNIDV